MKPMSIIAACLLLAACGTANVQPTEEPAEQVSGVNVHPITGKQTAYTYPDNRYIVFAEPAGYPYEDCVKQTYVTHHQTSTDIVC